jgi:hypothetical protein
MVSLTARLLVALTLAWAVVGGTATAAADGTIKTGVRTGPMIHRETTIGQVKQWFGAPQESSSDLSPCSGVTMSYWYVKGLVVGHRKSDRTVLITSATQPTISSQKHGEIEWKTGAGLQIGDSKSRMRNLHPNAKKTNENNGTEVWLLQRNRKGKLIAVLDSGQVMALGNLSKCK